MRSSVSPRRCAFSLVELLIVVGLIALLIGILLPVLRAAREDARAVRCASNVRQISLALVLYAEAHQGRLPIPCSAFSDPSGPYQAVCMTGWTVYDYDNGTLWPYLGAAGPDLRKQVFDCPADADSGFRPTGTPTTFPQQYGYKRNFTYNFNMWLRATDLDRVGTFPPPGVKVTDILHPAERILVFEQQAPADEIWNGNVAPGIDLATRHHGRGNQGFADGHVEPVEPLQSGGNYAANRNHYFDLFAQ